VHEYKLVRKSIRKVNINNFAYEKNREKENCEEEREITRRGGESKGFDFVVGVDVGFDVGIVLEIPKISLEVIIGVDDLRCPFLQIRPQVTGGDPARPGSDRRRNEVRDNSSSTHRSDEKQHSYE